MSKKRGYSIRRRLFRLLMTAGLLFVLVCAGAYSLFAYREAISARESYYIQTAASLAAQMDRLTGQMDIIACQVLASSELQKLMRSASRETGRTNYFDRSPDARRVAQGILWLFNSPTRVVQAINVFRSRDYVSLLNAPSQDRIDQISAMDQWKVPDRGCYLIPPHMDDWGQITGRPVISLVRAFCDTSSSFERLGTIEVQVTLDSVEEALSVEDRSMSSCVLDEENRILYPPEMQGVRLEVAEKDVPVSFTDARNVPSIGALSHMEKHGWKVLFFQEKSVYQAAVLRSMLLPAGMGLLLMMLGIAAFAMMARSFTQPIRQLTEAVQGVTLEHADALRELDTSIEEVNTLRDAFLERSEQLRDAAQQLVSASESELRLKLSVLQAHINPHFLYNSLMAISAAGQEGNADRVEEMCYQLGELYRYTDAEQPHLVTLAGEVENAGIYLAFMKYRYEEHLIFEIITEGDLESVRIPRLVLQPLIENCFAHGFLSIAPPFRMRLYCRADAHGWKIEVSDNGTGFEEETRKKLLRRFDEIDEVFASHTGYEKLSMDGLAIANVYIRLCSMYPGHVAAEVGRDENLGGAKISIIAGAERRVKT